MISVHKLSEKVLHVDETRCLPSLSFETKNEATKVEFLQPLYQSRAANTDHKIKLWETYLHEMVTAKLLGIGISH